MLQRFPLSTSTLDPGDYIVYTLVVYVALSGKPNLPVPLLLEFLRGQGLHTRNAVYGADPPTNRSPAPTALAYSSIALRKCTLSASMQVPAHTATPAAYRYIPSILERKII